MEKAKAAVSDFLSRSGHQDSSAHEQAAPQHENVTANVGKDLPQGQQMQDTTQGNMPQGNMDQGYMPQGNMGQGNMPHGNMGQGNMPQGNMDQGYMPQGDMSRGNMTQGYMPQGNMGQGNMPQGNMDQGYMPQGNMGQGDMSQGSMTQGNMPQGNMDQGYMPQGNMGQGDMSQGNMTQGNMPQDQTQGQQQHHHHHHHHTAGGMTGSTTSNTGGFADRGPDDQHQHADRGEVGQGNMMGSSTQGGVVNEQSRGNDLTSNRDDRTDMNRDGDDSGYAKGVVEGVAGDGENNLAHLKNESGELPKALTEKVSKAVPHSELHPEGEQAQGDQTRGDRAQGDQFQGNRAQGMQNQGDQAQGMQGMQGRDSNAADSTTQTA